MPYGIDEMARLAVTPEDHELVAKSRAMAAKATPVDVEPDFPAPHGQVGDWTAVDPKLYEAYAAGVPGAYEAIAKSVAEGPPATSGGIGESWLAALRDPAEAARAGRDYEAGFRGLDDELGADLDE